MIKHIVMFKLKNPDEAGEMRNILNTLDGKIDTIREWEVGINIGQSSKPYEVVVYSVFDDDEGLQTFRNHPKHLQVKEKIAGFIETSGTCDYEI